MVPPSYNDMLQIFQTPGYVAILQEMSNNDVRIIPLDGRPHLPQDLRQWLGDSRGRWEGDTLVVETVNLQAGGRNSSADTTLVERFTRVDAETVNYEVTVNDPKTWTGAWTAAFPLTKSQVPVYEYACHEGNYSLETVLRGARTAEKADKRRR